MKTIEEKAKAYDEALERARALNNGKDVDVESGTTTCEYIFPELKESEDEKIRKEIISILRNAYWTSNKNRFNELVAWIEKQGKNSTDKTKPRFKIGDWIVFNGLILYVKEVVNGFYRTISKGGIPNSYDWDIDNIARLWTIQDAKDGDVLVHSSFMFDDFIFIYNNTSILQAYCYYSNERNGFIIEDRGHHCPWNMQEVTPATKEQRDILMKAMNNAGYEWDTEKKELKRKKHKR